LTTYLSVFYIKIKIKLRAPDVGSPFAIDPSSGRHCSLIAFNALLYQHDTNYQKENLNGAKTNSGSGTGAGTADDSVVIDQQRWEWSQLWKKEDWWAIWLGFLLIVVGILIFLPSRTERV
jgi:hypothetical protein